MIRFLNRKWTTKETHRVVLNKYNHLHAYQYDEICVFELQESNYGEKRAFEHTENKSIKVNYSYACGIIGGTK